MAAGVGFVDDLRRLVATAVQQSSPAAFIFVSGGPGVPQAAPAFQVWSRFRRNAQEPARLAQGIPARVVPTVRGFVAA